MVNPGHPSRGCFECRRKKIKCDEAIPQCVKCVKSGKPCPGYRPLADTTFKVSVVARRKLPSPTSQPIAGKDRNALLDPDITASGPKRDDFGSSGQTKSAGGSPERLSPVLRYSPSTPWESLALPLFFNMFTHSPSSSPGMLSFLPQMYAQAGTRSCLGLALDAAVEANAVRKLTDSKAIYRARTKHLVALSAVKHAVMDPSTATEDATLCSLYILTLFEYISGDTIISHGSHIDGYEALLTLRNKVLCQENLPLYQDIVGQILVKHLRTGSAPSPGLAAVIESNAKADPRSSVTLISLRICQFNNTASKYMDAPGTATGLGSELLWIFTTGQQMDTEFEAWPYPNDDSWAFSVFEAPLTSWSGPFHAYGSLIKAVVWNVYRSARLMLLLNLLKCAGLLLNTEDPAPDITRNVHDIKGKVATLIGDIIASYPYLLGRGDSRWAFPTSGIATAAYTLIWPTGLILRCPFATPKQKAITVSTMDYIGKSLGIQRSLNLKDAWVASQRQSGP